MARKPRHEEPPPHNLELEADVICAMLASREVADYALDALDADDFHSPANRELFASIGRAVRTGIPWESPGMLAEWIRADGLDRKPNLFGRNGVTAREWILLRQADGLPTHKGYQCRVLRRLRRERECRLLAVELSGQASAKTPTEWCDYVLAEVSRLHARIKHDDASDHRQVGNRLATATPP